MPVSHASFPVRHKIDNIGIFVLLKYENKLDNIAHHWNYHSKNYDKCKFLLKLIQVEAISNFFPFRSCTKIPALAILCITEKLDQLIIDWCYILSRSNIPQLFCKNAIQIKTGWPWYEGLPYFLVFYLSQLISVSLLTVSFMSIDWVPSGVTFSHHLRVFLKWLFLFSKFDIWRVPGLSTNIYCLHFCEIQTSGQCRFYVVFLYIIPAKRFSKCQGNDNRSM